MTPDQKAARDAATFQTRVDLWIQHCFGPAIGADRIERNHRFIEEALELVQAGGCTASEAHQLVDYVFSRPVGDLPQEVGGVMNTLAAFCNAHGVDLDAAAEAELRRVWGKSDQIRAKQAAKPKHSPLPAALRTTPPPSAPEITQEQARVVEAAYREGFRDGLSAGQSIGPWKSENAHWIGSDTRAALAGIPAP